MKLNPRVALVIGIVLLAIGAFISFGSAPPPRIIATALDEEGYPPASLYDFVQRIAAVARGKTYQDDRIELEGKARRLLERAN